MTRRAELFAQVYADPDADGPRLALADLLQLEGDPRGEFLALQLLRPDADRERALIARHGRDWLGALADVVELGELSATRFVRGFLAVADVRRAEAVASAPEWATVEELHGQGADLALASAALPSLRRFGRPVTIEQLAVIARRAEPLSRVTRVVHASYARWSAAQLRVLGACANLPALDELVVCPTWTMDTDDVCRLVAMPVAARLARLVLQRPRRPKHADGQERAAIATYVRALAAVALPARVVFPGPGGDVVLSAPGT